MALTKAQVLKVFKKKYKYELAGFNQYVNAIDQKNSLWVVEIEFLCEDGLITDEQLQGWAFPFK